MAFNKHTPKPAPKNADSGKSTDKPKGKLDGKKDGKGAPLLNRRQKQKVSDLVKQLRVRINGS